MFNGLKKFFSRKSGQPYSPYMAFANYLAINGWSNLSAYQSIQYYMQCSPLYDAINRVTEEASNVRLFMFNLKTEKFDKTHPLLDLLKHPNTDFGSHEFMEQMLGYYLITGNCYIIATGQPNRPPLELYIAPPQYMSIVPNADDGFPQTYNFSSNSRSYVFNRETVEGNFRYYTPDKTMEIYHIRKFNPLRSVQTNYGLSPLTSLFYEIEQYLKSDVYNLSLLTRGGRPSGAVETQETLSDEAFAQLQEQMDRFNAGAENSGRMLLLQHGLTYKEMGLSPRDMDFEKLRTHLTMQFYNVYKIPLALISPQSMTYNNLETANLSFYDFAVLPLLNRMLEELSNFLMYRYKEQGKKELSYDKNSIPALQLRQNENLKALKEIGVNSINELRAFRGEKPVIGGNDIYGSGMQFPIARTAPRTAQEEAELGNAESTDIQEPEKSLRQEYYTIMNKYRREDGTKAFTREQLQQWAVKYGLTSE